MAGRIRDEDVVLVREKARIDEVVRDYVTLKSAGGGSLKGLCPFHDERSPSFSISPAKGAWYCFGCGEGGDVIGFLRKIDHLSFTEAVEKLAGRYGVTLRYTEGSAAPGRQAGNRSRLVEANKTAAAFFVERLASPEAEIGRRFLTERGFDSDAAKTFGVGYAPKGWDVLLGHLRSKGFTDDQLVEVGLVARGGQRGIYDRFRGRLVWPIRDTSGDVVGFGARKLYDDDEGPKYLNTPETPLYKKSQVLYGIDLARKEIAKRKQAVIVEGYTDVMAAHLSGVETAVATCGTSFGADHISVLRRLLMDDGVFTGEVVFTFDGDAAGQKAAQRAFSEDQRFTAQTFVAVEPSGMDPCELRIAQGPDAVRELVDRKVPLFEFAIRTELKGHDLDRAEGRVAGLRAAAPVVARIRDEALRPEYVRLLSGWLAIPDDEVRRAVQAAGKAQPPASRPYVRGACGVRRPGRSAEAAAAGPARQGRVRGARGAQGGPAGSAARRHVGRRARDRGLPLAGVHRRAPRDRGGRGSGGRPRGPRLARRRARSMPGRRRPGSGARARGGAVADRRDGHALRAVGGGAPARDRRVAPDHRSQGAPAAYRARKRAGHLSGPLRRRPRPRAVPPRPPRAGRRRWLMRHRS